MVKTNRKKETLAILSKLFELLGVSAQLEVVEEDGIKVSVRSETPALIIGYHGKTLEALQIILGAILYKKFGEKTSVVIDVDGWRARHEEKLSDFAKNIAERVRESRQEENIYHLSPSERRVIHIALSGEEGIVTESLGEGKDRYLVVKPSGK